MAKQELEHAEDLINIMKKMRDESTSDEEKIIIDFLADANKEFIGDVKNHTKW